MEKLKDEMYKLSSGHIFEIKVPPLPKVFKIVSLLGTAIKKLDIEEMIKKLFGDGKKLEEINIEDLDISVLKDLLAFLMEQEELFSVILENMKSCLLDSKPATFEEKEYREDLLEAIYLYLKDTLYPFIKAPISRYLTLGGHPVMK